MRVLRISIFQRKLGGSIDLATTKKLSQLRTDFLLFPEYCFTTENTGDFAELAVNSDYILEWLKKLSDTQSSVLIGGTLLRETTKGKLLVSVPILYEGDLINHYDKQELSSQEKKVATAGKSACAEMLKNFRFSILCGREFENKKLIEKCVNNDISVIFLIANSSETENIEHTYEMIEEYAEKYQICFIRCCATGPLLGATVFGRSFACMKSGISWKVTNSGIHSEMIQTIILNV